MYIMAGMGLLAGYDTEYASSVLDSQFDTLDRYADLNVCVCVWVNTYVYVCQTPACNCMCICVCVHVIT
jgi:hypothetical protein